MARRRSETRDGERGFLGAILEHPEEAVKLIYADWLDERDDPRGEFLRLMVKTPQARSITPEQRRRHDELCTFLADHHARHLEESSLDQCLASPETSANGPLTPCGSKGRYPASQGVILGGSAPGGGQCGKVARSSPQPHQSA